MANYSPGDDVFRSEADSRFNSFVDPSALAYNNRQGNWGINSNLLTPSYTAAYRPQYNGSQGNSFGAHPGFFQSLNQTVNPFSAGGTNYGGNTYQQQSPYYDTLGYDPLDRGANIAQKWVVPGFASWLSYRYLAKPLGNMGGKLGAGIATGMSSGTLAGGELSTMARFGGGLGRLAGATLGPMAIAEAAVWGADKAIFDPYIAQRSMSNDLRRNFAGVTFGGEVGNEVTGKGFSRAAASSQATQLSVMAAKDFTFNQSEVSNLTDLSARSGLLDTSQGGNIADRMKMITKQVKLVMQIGNTSDFKEAIEILSKLQTSGVATKDVTQVMSRLGGMASTAGVSLQKMMATVGAQGEYMFGSNGLNPYTGALAAGNAYGAFSMAQRTGLISNSALARMGGVEGATQSTVGAQLAMAQTPYSMMAAYNRYTGGATSGSVVGTVSNFGSSMAGNPLAALGRFNMTAAGFASRSIEEGGLARTTDDLITMAKSGQFNGAINKNGKLDAGAAYQMLTASMGFTDQQAKAYLQAQQAAQDSGVAGQSGQALMNSWAETRQKLLEQQGIGSRGQRLVRPFYTRANEMQGATSKVIGKGLEKVGRGVDSLEKWWMGPEADDTNKLINGMAEEGLNTEFNYSGGDSDDQGVVRKLANNKDVIDAVKSKDSEAIRLAIQNEVDKGTIDSDYAKGAKLESLVTTLKGQGVKGPMTPAEQKAATEKMLLKVTGAHSVDKARDIISLGMKIHKQGDTFSKEDLERLSKDTDIKFSSANRDSAKSYLSVMAASYNGVTNTGDMGAMLSGLTSKATIQTGMDKLAQDLAQKIDFSGMKLDAKAMEVQATTVNITIGGETKTYNKDASSTKKASAPAFLRNMMQNP